MASNKKRLQGLIGGNDAAPAAPAPIQRGVPYQISTQTSPVEPELPLPASALSAPLQEIARRYIGARRRSGEALLEASRWLSEARSLAQHGEWYIFLEATGTTEDTAERLLNIHIQAMQNPQFAEAISRNWLSQSAAGLLARPSTPSEVVAEVLGGDKPPSVAEVERKIRKARRTAIAPSKTDSTEQIPQIAGSPMAGVEQIPQIAGSLGTERSTGLRGASPHIRSSAPTGLDVLREVADTLTELIALADEIPGGPEAEHILAQIEQALTAIRSALR